MRFEKRPITILLIDDREENLIALEDMLEADNRTFLKATSGNEGLKLALKNDNIGLVMLDVQMPGMDGYEVAELLKSNARTKEISIIFVTAINKEEHHALRGFEQGAVDYLQKPLDINITKAKVKVFEQLYFYQQDLKNTIAEKNSINAQLERFMYVVAHDLKSPLSGVISLLYMMKDDNRITKEEELSYYMKLMLDASTHLTDMIGSILEYSRKNNLDQASEKVNVADMVAQIAHLLFAPKHIHITVDDNMPTITTKKLKLQQVFQNLISNAIKYIDKPRGQINVGCIDEEEFYKFYIKDNGPGIAEHDQERIFRLFEKTENKSHGDTSTGVGLNIMKMLVEEQGGKVSVDSTPGVGSTFYFEWRK